MKIVFNMPIKLELFISILVVFNINLVNKTINNTLVFMTNIIIGDTRKEFDNSVVTYSTVYKLCALVDIQKTLMFLCCVPYLQISGSHAFTIALRLRTKLLKQVK